MAAVGKSLVFWEASREARGDGRIVRLDPREAALLLALDKYGGASIETLAVLVFGRQVDRITVGQYVLRLRRKLGRRRIVSIPKLGYRLSGKLERRLSR